MKYTGGGVTCKGGLRYSAVTAKENSKPLKISGGVYDEYNTI